MDALLVFLSIIAFLALLAYVAHRLRSSRRREPDEADLAALETATFALGAVEPDDAPFTGGDFGGGRSGGGGGSGRF